MKCRGPKKWYVYKTMSGKTKEKLVRRNIRSVGVYIRRDVVLLAWCGAIVKIFEDRREFRMWVTAIKSGYIYETMRRSVAKRISEGNY